MVKLIATLFLLAVVAQAYGDFKSKKESKSFVKELQKEAQKQNQKPNHDEGQDQGCKGFYKLWNIKSPLNKSNGLKSNV